ncbi:MAG: FAD-dependent oxidoreductase [Desulfobacterales bacterium]|nr:MAG: FAD-dependent oxidoreductase [Desulfobacterales bacterium]
MKEAELLVIGAGPGGLAAAVEAARAGAKVTLLDENPQPGGQIYRQLPAGFRLTDPKALGRDFPRGQKLLAEFAQVRERVEYLDEALIWGVFQDSEVAFQRGQNSHSLRYRKLIVSVGAYERPVPFPGWTLPGVLTAGGAQRLVKIQRVLPGEKILLAGTGPLLLALANQIVDAGGQVAAIVEAGRIENWWRLARGAWGQWPLVADAWHYYRGIRQARIPLLRGHIITAARGDGQVAEAVVAEADRQWRPRPGTARIFRVDTVCLGYGFVPSVELTRLAQCDHRYDPQRGGWIPVRNEAMETSVPGVYAAGDCTGVAGSLVAVEEGRIAGIGAAQSLGYLSAAEAHPRLEACRRRRAGLLRLRQVLDEISMPRPGLYELAQDDTIVCRCEEITLGEIKKALREGPTDMNEIKRMTRMGMGACQGRMCAAALQEIMAREKGVPPAELGFLNPRPPVKPVPLPVLAGHQALE